MLSAAYAAVLFVTLTGLILGKLGQGETKKKKSRWELTDPGITEQVQLKLRLDDIQRKLSLADCGVSKEDPSERCVVRPTHSQHEARGARREAQVEMSRDACLWSGLLRQHQSMIRWAIESIHARSGHVEN